MLRPDRTSGCTVLGVLIHRQPCCRSNLTLTFHLLIILPPRYHLLGCLASLYFVLDSVKKENKFSSVSILLCKNMRTLTCSQRLEGHQWTTWQTIGVQVLLRVKVNISQRSFTLKWTDGFLWIHKCLRHVRHLGRCQEKNKLT